MMAFVFFCHRPSVKLLVNHVKYATILSNLNCFLTEYTNLDFILKLRFNQ